MSEPPQVPPDAILCARRGEPISEGDLQQVAEFAAFLAEQAELGPNQQRFAQAAASGKKVTLQHTRKGPRWTTTEGEGTDDR